MKQTIPETIERRMSPRQMVEATTDELRARIHDVLEAIKTAEQYERYQRRPMYAGVVKPVKSWYAEYLRRLNAELAVLRMAEELRHCGGGVERVLIQAAVEHGYQWVN